MNEKKPTAIIADDEPLLRAQLAEALAALWPELAIVGAAAHGEEAVQLVARDRPDIVFLDIEMPGMTGLQAAAQIKGLAHIVFVTAYDRYAVEAFERGALDYVLKPATIARLRETVERLKARVREAAPSADDMARVLAQVAAALGKPNPARLKWIQASIGNQIRLIPVADVLYFQSDLKYTRVVTREAEPLIRKPLKELLDELEPEVFWQVHRATIVNSTAIAHVVREDDRLSLALKHRPERIEVSRSFAHLFRSM
ncbi:MAG: LytTR family DNA-binding domain-containing protein [Pseudomonadota bacterium]